MTIDASYRIVKNSVAMFSAAALAKGGGLIVTILVARYLDASSLGVYAVVLSLSLLLEMMTPIGQQEVILRAIARNQSLMINYWVNASTVTIIAAFGFAFILSTIVKLNNFEIDFTLALLVVAVGLPIAGLNLVSQAVLQGAERMEYQAFAAFIGRLLGLLFLWLALEMGAGVWSAFAGRAIFQFTSLLILARAIYRHARQNNLPRNWVPSVSECKKTIFLSMPFALQRFLNEGLVRINVIILPILVALEAVGQFNAAYQITQTSSTVIPIVMLTVMPIFARSFINDRSKMGPLTNQTLKFLLIIIFPFVFIVTVAAPKIIWFLFGTGYESAGGILQLIIWSQIFIAADSVMKQNMIASDNEQAMVWRSAVGMTLNIVLTVLLSKFFGILGIAAAIVISIAFLFMLDIDFVIKNVSEVNLAQAAGKPLICASLAGIIAFTLINKGLLIILSITVGVYVTFLLVFKVFTTEELLIAQQIFRRFLTRITALFDGKNTKTL